MIEIILLYLIVGYLHSQLVQRSSINKNVYVGNRKYVWIVLAWPIELILLFLRD